MAISRQKRKNITASPGLQVMWSSDVKIYHSERKFGRLMIEKNAWTAMPFVMDSDRQSGFGGSRQSITVNVDNDLHQAAAMDVIVRASDNLIANLKAQ